MRIISLALLLPVLAACAGGPAWTQDPAQVEFKDFLQADADGSGKLSPAEAKAFPAVSRDFVRYDADGDGLVAWNELRRVGVMAGDRQLRYEPGQR